MPPPKVDNEAPAPEHDEDNQRTHAAKLAAKLENPLLGLTQEQVLADVDAFTESKGLAEHRDVFRKGALMAQAINIPNGFEDISMLDEEDKAVLRREVSHRWSQPFMLYFLCALCAGSAIVQGMDQTAVNGAQVGSATAGIGTIDHDLTIAAVGILLRDLPDQGPVDARAPQRRAVRDERARRVLD